MAVCELLRIAMIEPRLVSMWCQEICSIGRVLYYRMQAPDTDRQTDHLNIGWPTWWIVVVQNEDLQPIHPGREDQTSVYDDHLKYPY